jgi:uncharacterized membrane protein
LLGLAVAVVVGALLRSQALGQESLWYDEVNQYRWTDQRLGRFLLRQWTYVAPPLNEVLAWAWNNALRAAAPRLAIDEAWIRLPTVACGVATIGVAGLAARAAFGPAAGVLAALLLATNPYHVRYSQEARMYALTTLLAAATILFLVRTLRGGGRRDAVACGVVAAAAVYAHYYAFLVLAALTAASAVAFLRTRAPHLRALLRGEALGIAVSAPYLVAQLVHAVVRGRGARGWLERMGTPSVGTIVDTGETYALHALGPMVATLAPGSLDALLTTATLVALAGLLALGLCAARDDEPRYLRLHLALAAFAPVILIVLVSQFRQSFHPRYFLCCFPALLLLVVRGRPRLLVAVLALAPIATGALVEPRYHAHLLKPDYRGGAARLLAEFRAGDALGATRHDVPPLRHYVATTGVAAAALRDAIEEAADRDALEVPLGGAAGSLPVPPGGRLYEIDARLMVGSVTRAEIQQRLEEPLPAADPFRTKVFESVPFPALRVWRRDS